jgi:hypothetical protein
MLRGELLFATQALPRLPLITKPWVGLWPLRIRHQLAHSNIDALLLYEETGEVVIVHSEYSLRLSIR